MPSEDVKRFFDWAKKVKKLLQQNSETFVNELPDAYKWMSYREQKILEREPENYQQIQDEFIKLSGETAKKLHLDCLQKLKEARKHRIGTKVRLRKILLYVYYYMKYIHPKFIFGEMENEAELIIKNFWSCYLDELIEYRKAIDPDYIHWLIEFEKLTKDMEIKIDRRKFSKIEDEYKLLLKDDKEIEFEEKLLREFEKDLDCWESQKVEFKKRATSKHVIAESIAGFATAEGGRIYIGVRPDKTVEGIEGLDTGRSRDVKQRQILDASKQIVKPAIRVKVHFILVDFMRTIVRIDVPKGNEPIYFADYRPYIRDLSSTRKLNPLEVKHIYHKHFQKESEEDEPKTDERSKTPD